jgi:hypothetical protein
MNNRAQILISAVDQTKTAFDWIKRVNGVLANLGVGVSLAGMTALVKSSIDAADELSKMSQRVGVKSRELINLLAKKIGPFLLPLLQGFDRCSVPEGRLGQLVVVQAHVTLQG